MKKAYIIINPMAGTRQAGKHLISIVEALRKGGYESTVAPTTASGDGVDLAERAASEYDIIIAIGGDGTFNEVASGIKKSGADIPIGYIPAGSTNDFAEALGLSTNFVKAAEDIVTGHEKNIDTGNFNGRQFSYIASFGAFTGASYSAPQSVKNVLGHFAYILQGVKELSNIRSNWLTIRVLDDVADEDSIYEDEYIFGAVCNTTSVAGILTLDQELVDMSDGEFELLLIKAPESILELNHIIFAITMQKFDSDLIEFVKASKISISAPKGMDWTLDGEFQEGAEEILIENMHNAIKVIVPDRSNR
ncbi:MAG: YegS/Rv2252/BmrU family lipid kinase [Peptostreptococcaceae bacterium]|nr:YegS/Rv2252/BmrU family lipid kinase [Peptostreptococcaceae bacterium]MDY5739840.1 YegS/Rv2252/BmrU family lipid kinase [Anaerovoracaceae bacterium]